MVSTKSSSPLKLKHDGTLTIAAGRSRKERNWENRKFLWSQLLERLKKTVRTHETCEEYRKLPKSEQDSIKDVGGFVGGVLNGGRRKTGTVESRQLITLDADFVKGELWASVETMLGCAAFMYSTHKHSPENPRLRLVIPLKRPVNPDEYEAVSRKIAGDMGIDFFDDTTFQPHRLMYWPSTSCDGEFVFKFADEAWLDPDEVLARYDDWRDQTLWPQSSRINNERKAQTEKQGNPREKPGMIGAFCRTYSISSVISTFLNEVYAPCDISDRYTYTKGSSFGGLILYEHGDFAYSHHGTDPAGGRLCNSFDLVRIHKFGKLDENAESGTASEKLPSYGAMLDFCSKDEKVKLTLGEERLNAARLEFEGLESTEDNKLWLAKLDCDKRGVYKPTIDNVLLILENDPYLIGKIAHNEFSHRTMMRGNLPWHRLMNINEGDPWNDCDDAGLRHYIETVYGIVNPSKISDALLITEEKHKYHPIRDYLGSLHWDGVPRVDNIFIDYLGAEDCAYVKEVTRKSMVASVARIFEPGVKFDYMLVLAGRQGIGKSHIISLLGQSWYSDSLNTVLGKEAYEQLQDAWIIEMAELSATKKVEVEAVKHFISKREDIYRMAYGRRVTKFPRQCVFFGTTNDMEFLRDKTGNRRFWPVMTGINKSKKSLWLDMNQKEIDEIWAEAVVLFRKGEAMYLEPRMESEAVVRQQQHTEESSKYGMIVEYLDRLLPPDWEELDIGDRRCFLHGGELGETPHGTVKRERVCAMEIWVELFQGDPKQMNSIQSREINDILRMLPGWEPYTKSNGKLRFGSLYGLQRAFVRKTLEPA